MKKADGMWTPCGDYRLLNLQTQPDLYTCPNIANLTARLEGCTIFSKLDLRKGFHQIPVRSRDMPALDYCFVYVDDMLIGSRTPE